MRGRPIGDKPAPQLQPSVHGKAPNRTAHSTANGLLPVFFRLEHPACSKFTGRTSSFFASKGIESFPKILRRVADPVEPFGFKSVQNDLLPPLLDGIGDRLGKQPSLFDQLEE